MRRGPLGRGHICRTVLVIALLAAPVAAAPPTTAEVEALGGAVPPSFDIYPADPCAGMWTAYARDGRPAGQLMVIRWRGTPLLHFALHDGGATNVIFRRVDRYTLRIGDREMMLTLRCRPGAEHLLISSPERTTILPVRAAP